MLVSERVEVTHPNLFRSRKVAGSIAIAVAERGGGGYSCVQERERHAKSLADAMLLYFRDKASGYHYHHTGKSRKQPNSTTTFCNIICVIWFTGSGTMDACKFKHQSLFPLHVTSEANIRWRWCDVIGFEHWQGVGCRWMQVVECESCNSVSVR